MKLPPAFSTGDPSYFVVASTSGRASPAVLTLAKGSAGVCLLGLCFIDTQYSPSREAIQSQFGALADPGSADARNPRRIVSLSFFRNTGKDVRDARMSFVLSRAFITPDPV